MKNCLFLCLLLLPTFLTAQKKPVQVPKTCVEGNPFTIRIPVRFPAGVTVEYEWYRNGALIKGTRKTLAAGEKIIAYTIPADKAFGNAVAYHFKYRRSDDECYDCEEWSSSPKFMLSFMSSEQCKMDTVGSIVGSGIIYCAAASGGTITGGEIDVCEVSNVGGIVGSEIIYCVATSGGTISSGDIDVCEVSNAGDIVGSGVSYCVATSGGTISGGDIDVCKVSNAGGIVGSEVAYCVAVSGGTITGGEIDVCKVSNAGGIVGSGVSYCTAVSGGTITGSDVAIIW